MMYSVDWAVMSALTKEWWRSRVIMKWYSTYPIRLTPGGSRCTSALVQQQATPTSCYPIVARPTTPDPQL